MTDVIQILPNIVLSNNIRKKNEHPLREDTPGPIDTCEKGEGGGRGRGMDHREIEVVEDEGGNGGDKEEESDQGR